MVDIEPIADLLDGAARLGVSLSPLALRHGLTLADAYAVQQALVARRLSRGEALAGLKMGFTSEAMRRQMGVDRPNIGWLTSGMTRTSELATADFIHPRLEPEVAVLLGRDLEGTESIDEMAASVAGYAPAIEVVDSRFHDYKFHWLDNVADNSSSAAYVVGAWKQVCDVAAIKARLHLDGELIDEGESSDVMGHPLAALAEGARIAGGLGQKLRAGMVILTGGITRAHPIAPGQTALADFGGLGSVSLLAR